VETYLRKEARRHGSSLQVVDAKKEQAAKAITIENLDKNKLEE
jgi:hypothetical protein